MSEINQAQQEELVEEELIADYLMQNPNFFNRFPSIAEKIEVPHGQQGVFSLVELQLQRQRGKIAELEEEITQLITVASHNEKIFEVYADLYPELLEVTTLGQLTRTLARCFKEKLMLSALALKLDPDYFDIPFKYQGFTLEKDTLCGLRTQKLRGKDHYFGRISEVDKTAIFGPTAVVNSVALIELGNQGEQGLLAIGSPNANHYSPEMDTLLLDQVCRFISILLHRLLQKK